MHRALMTMALAAGLAGCGKPAEQVGQAVGATNYTIKGADGAAVTVATGPGALAVKPPSYAPIYPGAVMVAAVAGGGGQNGSGAGGSVTFRTTAKAADLLAFYQQRTAAAGFRPTMTTQSGDGFMFSAGAESGERAIQVIASPDNGGMTVQMYWAQPKGG